MKLPTPLLRRFNRDFPGLIIASCFLLHTFTYETVAAAAQVVQLRAMTYNLRFASTNSPNSWQARRPAAKALLRSTKPDIIGTQEGFYQQLRDIAEDSPRYDWIGLGRDGGSEGEFMAVFYRRDRFEPVEFDHFWLSDTPNLIGSRSWGNRVKRMVTWVRFRDKASRSEFVCFNTHFDHQSQPAREKSAHLINSRIAEVTNNLPVLLLGDFNAALANNPVHEILTRQGGLTDTWLVTPEKGGELAGTFHDYGEVRADYGRIDWILFRGPWKCYRVETPRFSLRGQRPSDHWPVFADLSFSIRSPDQTLPR